MKIRLVGAEFRANGRTDRQDEANSRKFPYVPGNSTSCPQYTAHPRSDLYVSQNKQQSFAYTAFSYLMCVCLSVHRRICVEKKNQLDVTECFIALIIRSTCFGHFYAHHQEL